MKLRTWRQWTRKFAASPLPVTDTSLVSTALAMITFNEAITASGDHQLLGAAHSALNDQLHALIDRNADGIHHAAVQLRRETDLLLSLGISDPFAAKTGSYAQIALELANAGRGVNLQAQACNINPAERADLVARAMSLMLRAEMLMGAAKKNNLVNIEFALVQQEQRLRQARVVLLCSAA